MPLIETLERLSFGGKALSLRSCLGLYLSADAVFLAEASFERGVRVHHLFRFPLSPPSAGRDTKTGGSLQIEMLSDTEALEENVRKALSGARLRTRHVQVTLSHHFGILRYFTLPAIDRRFWKTAIPVEAKKYIPLPFDSLIHDYQAGLLAPGQDKRPRMGVLMGVTPAKALESVRALVQKLGLQLAGLELAPCSVERLWDAAAGSPGPYAHVHFDSGTARVLISYGGLPVFFRETFLGAEASAADARKVDLAGCVEFAFKQLGERVPMPVRLSGQVADRPAWQQAFSQATGMPVEAKDVDGPLGLKRGEWGGYAAVGAALKPFEPGQVNLDLSRVGKVSEEDKRAALSIILLSGLLSGLCLLGGVLRYWLGGRKAGEVERLRLSGRVIEELGGKSAEEIEMSIARMREQARMLEATSRQVSTHRWLKAVAEAIPEEAWVTQFQYGQGIPGAGTPGVRSLKIMGAVAAGSLEAEQELVFRFAERLRQDPEFSKAFKSVEPSVESSSEEQRRGTTYSIACASERGPTR